MPSEFDSADVEATLTSDFLRLTPGQAENTVDGQRLTQIPNFSQLLPDYSRLWGFRARMATLCPNPPLPRLPTNYFRGPELPPRDRIMEWFAAIHYYVAWERTAALFEFQGFGLGDFEDLVAIEGWGRTILQPFIQCPDMAYSVAVRTLDREPALRLSCRDGVRLDPGANREVPVLDLRTDPESWLLPYEPDDNWAPAEWQRHPLRDQDIFEFCRNLDWQLRDWDDIPETLTRSILVLSRPAADQSPEAVLRRLTDSIWNAMRTVTTLAGHVTLLPPRPPSTTLAIDRLNDTFDGLGNWVRETLMLYPEFPNQCDRNASEGSRQLPDGSPSPTPTTSPNPPTPLDQPLPDNPQGHGSTPPGGDRKVDEANLAKGPTSVPDPPKPTAVLLSSADLAKALGLAPDRNRVDVALRRYAEQHPACRDGVKNPRKGEPRFLYRVEHVWPLLLSKLRGWRGSSATMD
jgi:hypothetical protein